ncbi:Electron transfer flavoprotein regulatory factor 1 [Hondaea fermentalgiana]|uniref:Electron transfer flavoprotein regulatory factor 1 n=1 Tax=Hondaea fermentalgiana TaxID=2315210 RepID=A0A2R5GAV0_9STRA|nr:Electron transfer flavoprotein regulatory factor 1 [Hondaea fermentalgiana]|eukprot:GBG26858.1 Electron transfer flavoprotein regulatory factor 1 [Hondaea fermentalgiana]
MHPLVRDLYKRLLTVGKEYPQGLDWVKSKAKPWIMQNAALTDEVDIKKKVAEGRFWVREMQSVIKLKKYRTLKKRYY